LTAKKEAARFSELQMLQKAGEISDLEFQVSFEIIPAVKIGNKKVRARFLYRGFPLQDERRKNGRGRCQGLHDARISDEAPADGCRVWNRNKRDINMDKPDQIEEMKLSRVMRRAKAKLAKQERRNVPQRHVITNPVQHAILRAAKLTPAEVKLMIDPIKEDIQALRTGKFNNTMFKHLADSFNVAQALTEPRHWASAGSHRQIHCRSSCAGGAGKTQN
jgi:hypothetical protein